MRIVVFLDLDDTIFQTLPKCPEGEAVWPVAYRRDGTPLSFMTAKQRALLDLFFRSATVIPTTARNLDALRRVDLPFDNVRILDFGGVVLHPDGNLDESWDAQVRPRALELGPELRGLHSSVERFSAERGLGVNARLIADFDMPLYIVVKHPGGDSSTLQPVREEMQRLADGKRFFIHCNDNNLSLVPRFLGKERAVEHVLRNLLGPEPVLTVGLGDSLTDGPFLDLCDFRLMPLGCQLARKHE